MNPNFFNLSKKKNRDILPELLTGEPSVGLVSKKELKALHSLIGDSQKISSTTGKPPEKTEKKTVREKKKETKKKTTHYLSAEVFKSLDRATKKIRTIAPENLHSSVSKSQIVNQALSLVLKEFEDKGENSRLMRTIIQKK